MYQAVAESTAEGHDGAMVTQVGAFDGDGRHSQTRAASMVEALTLVGVSQPQIEVITGLAYDT